MSYEMCCALRQPRKREFDDSVEKQKFTVVC